MKKVARLLIVLLSLTVLWGCELALIGLGAGVGIGTYKFIEGELARQYPVEYNKAWDVTNTALSNLQISVAGSLNEGVKGDIEGIRKDGVKVYVSLKDMGQKVTHIGVRVGTFGNRVEAERIHDEIVTVAGI
ncbi:MAG: DUF3568 family protein [Nitrospirae bacterium]|nr:DUF3568 family protein [Nitrospirota bacterium]